MLSMQSGAGRSPYLYLLLFLFATLVMLLVSRRNLPRWACCRRLPSPDDIDATVEPLQNEGAGAEVEADVGAEAEAEAEAEGVPLGLAVESAGQPEAPAELGHSAVAGVVRVHLSPESEEPSPPVLPAANAAELAEAAADAEAQRQPDPEPEADSDGTAGQQAEAESQAPPSFPFPLPSSPSARVQAESPRARPNKPPSGEHWVATPLVEEANADDQNAAAAQLRSQRSPSAVAPPLSPSGRRRVEPVFPPDNETSGRGARLPPLRLPQTQNLSQPTG